MTEETHASASESSSLPDAPSLEWLRKQAKRRLEELRQADPDAKLADAQFSLAKQYGFSSWRALKAHVDSLTVDGQLFAAVRTGDVVGHGDDHELEVIGWATCWDGCDDAAHRAVADLLASRGARHHIFSAVAMSLVDEVRRLVAADPSVLAKRMSHNESFQLPLHFAVRKNLPEMVTLLLELGADPAATDGSGVPVNVYPGGYSVRRHDAIRQRELRGVGPVPRDARRVKIT